MIRRLPVSLKELLAGLYFPAVAVLLWQFYITYSGYAPGTGAYHDSIMWAPLKFMALVSPAGLFPKFLLSICFPLLVSILYWKQACRDTMLVLAWLCFLFGGLYTYLLAERLYLGAGNMVWSGYIAAFLLFFASIAFWVRQIAPARRKERVPGKAIACGVAIGLHASSGARLDWLYLTHMGCVTNFHLANFVCGK